MTTFPATAPIGAREAVATRIGFFVAGFGVASWAPLVVFAKARAGVDDGALGILLLGLGFGSIVAMPLAGAMAARYGCRHVIVAATAAVCVALPCLASFRQPLALAVALFVFGAGIGSIDCVINLQAVIVERAGARPMMSGFHGLYSVGGIVGAGGVSLLLGIGATPIGAALTVVACIACALVSVQAGLLASAPATSGVSSLRLPRGMVLFIGVLCFVVFLTEGAVLDWSAVYLTQYRGIDPVIAGLGYASFASAMAVGRLSGDLVVKRLGGIPLVIGGGLLAASGLAVAILVPGLAAATMGFGAVGAGCSNIVPVLYSAIGRQDTMPEHVAVTAVTTLGYAGILAGPALIGALAHVFGLEVALFWVAALMIGVSLSGPMLRRD